MGAPISRSAARELAQNLHPEHALPHPSPEGARRGLRVAGCEMSVPMLGRCLLGAGIRGGQYWVAPEPTNK
eukprot:15454501-Alexandrium_andersonii.AAC.1